MAGKNPQSGTEQGDDSADSPKGKPLENASMSYESINKFVIKVKGADGGDGEFVLRRQGIGWKLTQIIIALE
jgi:hypothetical protein